MPHVALQLHLNENVSIMCHPLYIDELTICLHFHTFHSAPKKNIIRNVWLKSLDHSKLKMNQGKIEHPTQKRNLLLGYTCCEASYHAYISKLLVSTPRHFGSGASMLFSSVYIWLAQDELSYHTKSLSMLLHAPIVPHCQNCAHVPSLVHLRRKCKS